ncbi:MAG: radical SAM protein, partial [Acidobacteriota bacterium]|nr:radical SAM protein [Acidobacteriota bacterium]
MSSTVTSLSDSIGLYLHIPFCSAICDYCNFNRGLYDEALKQRYVNAIKDEIERWDDGRSVDSIFFGGGTPSLLTAKDVSEILAACRTTFTVTSGVETTLEMNPESCTSSHVKELLAAGITRVSLGVQSFLDHELKRLGRAHTVSEARAAITAIRSAGCNNLS